MGVLTMIFTGIARVGRGLAMMNRTRGKTTRSGGWGLVLLLWLRLLSRRRQWWLLFLMDQEGETEA
jgi:hypothetical protein